MEKPLTIEQLEEILHKYSRLKHPWEYIDWLRANTEESKDMTLKEIDDKYFPNTDNSPKRKCPDCGEEMKEGRVQIAQDESLPVRACITCGKVDHE